MEFTAARLYGIMLCLAIGVILYSLVLAIYRIYLSPLSHIPGPKIAIATSWYECYHDVFRRGLYYKKVKEFHRKYGPIVRISPYEVHIEDSYYYDELNNNNFKWDKYAPFMAQFNSPGSTISTAEHSLHRMRRRPQNNFFSKRSIVALESVIHRHVESLCRRMEGYRKTQTPFPLNQALLCFSSDVVSEYAFGRSYGLLETDDLAPSLLKAYKIAGEASHTLKQWPWLVTVFDAVPLNWLRWLAPDFGLMLDSMEIARQNVVRIRSEIESGTKSTGSIFHALFLDPSLPPSEQSINRLAKEGFVITAAGGDTTANTTANILYHLITNPPIIARLRSELTPLFSNPSTTVVWSQLESLPYMSCVVKEGLRITHGASSRLARCAPDRATKYRDVTIPRGTPVSMSIPDVHLDPAIFPEPTTFRPERWWSDQGERTGLDRFLCAFAKGTRQCLGMNLAYAELYLVIAALVMRFDFELFETTADDVLYAHDFTIPHPRTGSKYIRVLVK